MFLGDGLKLPQFSAARAAKIPPLGIEVGKFQGRVTRMVHLGLHLMSLLASILIMLYH